MFGLRAFFKEENDLFTNRFGAYEKRAQGLTFEESVGDYIGCL